MARDGGQWNGRRTRAATAARARGCGCIVAAVNPVEGLIDLELAAQTELDLWPARGARAADAAPAAGAARSGCSSGRHDERALEIEQLARARRSPLERVEGARLRGAGRARSRTRASSPRSSRWRRGPRSSCSLRSRRAHRSAAAGARRRAGSAQSGRLPAHRRCLRRAGAGRAARSGRAAQCDGAQGRRRARPKPRRWSR